jgi:hypothetical protein
MSKRANGGNPKSGEAMTREKAPPLLSEKLIAQMQSAVSAAQRKRLPGLDEASTTEPGSSHRPAWLHRSRPQTPSSK